MRPGAAAALLLALCAAAAIAPARADSGRGLYSASGTPVGSSSTTAAYAGPPGGGPAAAQASAGAQAGMGAPAMMPPMGVAPPGAIPPGAMAAGPYMASASASSSSSSSGGPGPAGAASPCRTITDTSSSSCANGNCCAVKQRVTMCPKHTTAIAEINGVRGSCCVVMIRKKDNKPVTFCATPMKQENSYQFPANVAVAINPDCTNANGGVAPALSCTATFAKLPYGFTLAKGGPATFAANKGPWAQNLGPCSNKAYGGLYQSHSVDKVTRATTFTVKCQ